MAHRLVRRFREPGGLRASGAPRRRRRTHPAFPDARRTRDRAGGRPVLDPSSPPLLPEEPRRQGAPQRRAAMLALAREGRLTPQALWDPATGAFTWGAVVAGINDGPLRCTNV